MDELKKKQPHGINIHNIPWVLLTHVEINIFSFQMALQDTRAMLPQVVRS
jgi:hypothetical protein